MNTVIIHGRLTRDPEHRITPSGKSVVDFDVAVNRRRDRDKADFFRCEAWNGLADTINSHLHKGSEVCISGEMHSHQYEDKEGIKRYSWSIVVNELDFCGKKGE